MLVRDLRKLTLDFSFMVIKRLKLLVNLSQTALFRRLRRCHGGQFYPSKSVRTKKVPKKCRSTGKVRRLAKKRFHRNRKSSHAHPCRKATKMYINTIEFLMTWCERILILANVSLLFFFKNLKLVPLNKFLLRINTFPRMLWNPTNLGMLTPLAVLMQNR
jgi:hypothetical protein